MTKVNAIKRNHLEFKMNVMEMSKASQEQTERIMITDERRERMEKRDEGTEWMNEGEQNESDSSFPPKSHKTSQTYCLFPDNTNF